jgi:hypothetical protein
VEAFGYHTRHLEDDTKAVTTQQVLVALKKRVKMAFERGFQLAMAA